ncbi:hypothetical protein MMC16_005511 [Acarospora aff. strigata]|nr:hypothetical protein [Acarospora aff. strigata]
MFAFHIFALFVGFTLAAPLTSEKINILAKRAGGDPSKVECNVRYGWSLDTKDCQAAISKLPQTKISYGSRIMPDFSQSSPSRSSGPVLTKGLERNPAGRYTVSSGSCYIGVNSRTGGGIEMSEWGSVVGRAYNIIVNCVNQYGHGGKTTAGLLNNIDVMIWREDHEPE